MSIKKSKEHVIYQMKRMKVDLGYIVMNGLINKIPAWWLRRIFYRILGMQIGKNVRIGIGTIVIYPSNIKIGDNSIINEYCFLDGRGTLDIGKNASISIYSKLISASHKLNDDFFEYQYHPIKIEDYAFIGAGSIVLEDSILKRGCCIGAGAVAKGIYEEDSIYVGNPAKKILNRNSKYCYELFQNYYFR